VISRPIADWQKTAQTGGRGLAASTDALYLYPTYSAYQASDFIHRVFVGRDAVAPALQPPAPRRSRRMGLPVAPVRNPHHIR